VGDIDYLAENRYFAANLVHTKKKKVTERAFFILYTRLDIIIHTRIERAPRTLIVVKI
jgi:hypothetical protein